MGSFRQSPNDLLASLPAADFDALGVRSVALVINEVLVVRGEVQKLVYFPTSGIISKVINFAEGNTVEVAMIGREGVFGGSAALHGPISPNSGVVRFPGAASVVDVAQFQFVASRSSALRAALLRRQWVHIRQAEQVAACNAAHQVEARLCWRLLLLRDLARSGMLPLTQDVLAQMLGVQRNSVSLAANALQHDGVIRYSRGQIEILDVPQLLKRACECYEIIRPQNDGDPRAGASPPPVI
jgi:CRP-like cAMP-binding protein